jgi:WhiB family transcriptional regulator, redox-sensing transcriptional regulator
MDDDVVWELLAPAYGWMKDGLCVDRPDVDFFSQRGAKLALAKAVCAACVAREACLSYALDQGIVEGVWGGRSPLERRRATGAEVNADGRPLVVFAARSIRSNG